MRISFPQICTEWLVALCVSVFAGWTLYAHALVLTGQDFLTLQQFAPLCWIGIALLFWQWKRSLQPNADYAAPLATPIIPKPFRTLAIIFAIIAIYALSGSYTIFWLLSAVLLLFGCVLFANKRFPLQPITPEPGSLPVLFLCSAFSFLTALAVWRIHSDDAFYINMIAGTLDHPGLPLLSFDDMHGVPGLKLLMPVYKLQALELLIASLSSWLDASYLSLRNFWMSALLAPVMVAASAIFWQRLYPTRWMMLTVVTTAVMIIITCFSAGLSNYSFGKLQQGKAILVAILIPLTIAFAMDFYTAPDWRRWAKLALVQIAATGVTVNGLYLAPLVAGLALAGCWDGRISSIRRIVAGLAASLYPVALSLLMYWQMKDAAPIVHDLTAGVELNDPELNLMLGPAGYLFWLAALGGWIILADSARQRVALIMITLFMLLCMNPFLIDLWAANVTGVPTFRRIWWAIPRHLWLALLLAAPLLLLPLSGWKRNAAIVASAGVALVVFGWFASPQAVSMTQDYNQISYRWPPERKLPDDRITIVKAFSAQIPTRSYILVPDSISRWFVILPKHPYPVAVNENFLDQMSAAFGTEEYIRRRALLRYISGIERTEATPAAWVEGLERYQVRAVVTEEGNPWNDEIVKLLREKGFGLRENRDRYSLWLR